MNQFMRRLAAALALVIGSLTLAACGGGVSIGVSTQCDPGERLPEAGACQDPGRRFMRVCGANRQWGRPGCYPVEEGAAEPIAEEPIVTDDAAADATPTDAAVD